MIWSLPASLAAGCALAGAPQVAFPSEAPDRPTGAGAVIWSSQQSRCGGRAGAGETATAVSVARIGSKGPLRSARTLALEGVLPSELAAVGASLGAVALATGLRRGDRDAVQVLQGRVPRLERRPALRQPGAPFSLTRAYLGDVAVAAVAGAAIDVRVQRWFKRGFGPARRVAIGHGSVSALYATMDYRSDVLLAWQQNGAVYAEMLRASGRDDPVQRLGPSAANPQLQALVSDNNHGVVAWSSPAEAGRPSRTRVYVDRSGPGVRFGSPKLLASFADPAAAGRSPGSLAIVRLSTENAVIAWTAAAHGRYRVLGSPTGVAGIRPATPLSDPRRQAVLAGLAPGPEGEAIALWRGAGPGAVKTRALAQLWAARTFIVPDDRLATRPPDLIAANRRFAAVGAAVDPADDRAVVVWLANQGEPRVEYVVSRGHPIRHRSPAATPPGATRRGGAHWVRITLAALAGLSALAALALADRLRRRQGPGI